MSAWAAAEDAGQSRSRYAGIERSAIVQSARAGRVEYGAAAAWQRARAAAVARGELAEIVVLLEHPAVYTQGRRGGRAHLLVREESLGAKLVDTDRGGDLTFHGPGQAVVWPILRLRERGIGIASYVRGLEQVGIETAAAFGVAAERVRGRPGVWLSGVGGERKLVSIGVRVQSGVSRHGLAINADVDLSWFDAIRACGIANARAASLSEACGRRVSAGEAAAAAGKALAEVFALRLSPVPLSIGGV